MSNQVKVTLSADDQATEIVRRLAAAVKQLSDQNKRNNRNLNDGRNAADGAAASFNKMASAIAGVATAIGAIKILGFVKDTIDAADQLGKLAQKTGASTEALSALAVAASTADLSQEELGQGLKFLARSVTELQAGSQDVAAAFEALGLTASQLKGLSLDQIFVTIADAQAKFGDGAGKTAALMKIFGRSGEELIPLLKDLANGGFAQAQAKAQALGLTLDKDGTQAAQNFNDALTTLKNSARGLVDRLLPIAQALADMATAVANFVAQHPDLAGFGAGATIAAAGATALAAALGVAAIAAAGLGVALAPVLITIAAVAAVGGGIALLVKHFADAKKEAQGLADATKQASQNATANLPQVVLNDPAQVKALREARLAAQQQAAKAELDLEQSSLHQREQIEEASFAQGLTSLRQFYANRRTIVEQGLGAQVAALEAEKKALQSSPLSENTDAARVARTTQISALEEQIKKAKIDGQTQLLALLEQERVARKSIEEQVASFNAQIATAQGNQIGATQIQIAQTVQKFKEALLAQGNLSADAINVQANALSTLLTNRAAFEENQRKGQIELNDLALERNKIELQAQQGLISERDAQQQIAALERSRIPTLQTLADRMLFFAEQTKDPALIQAAKEFRAQFEGIGQVVLESQRLIANLGESIRGAIGSATSDFLTTGINSVLDRDTSDLDSLRARLKAANDELSDLEKQKPSDAATSRILQLRQQVQDLNVEIDAAKKQLPTIGDALRNSLKAAAETLQRAIADILAQKFVEKIFGDGATATIQITGAAATSAAAKELGAAALTVGGASTGLETAAGAVGTSSLAVSDAAGGVLESASALGGAGLVVQNAAAAIERAAAALAAAGGVAGGGGDQSLIGDALDVLSLTSGFASGGFVRGPGTATSDSIPARLSAGEFVIRAAAVRKYGVDFFRALNGARMPQLRRPSVSGLPAFASGGFVSGGGPSSANVSGEIGLHVSADDGLLVKLLGTRGGLKALRQVVAANPNAFKADLGIA